MKGYRKKRGKEASYKLVDLTDTRCRKQNATGGGDPLQSREQTEGGAWVGDGGGERGKGSQAFLEREPSMFSVGEGQKI